MRRLILIFTLWTMIQAKPEMYREKEDFQYSRSSSDDGHKSGYYGAQRGNMGGNFEKSHNMDGLAQHQMSGLVRQVEGELGDTSKAREGNVFSSANSRGFYGSGTYDLSNLQGRNFGEGTTLYDSQASQSQSGYSGHSAHSSQSMSQSSQHHDRRSGYGGYQYRGQAGQAIQTDDQQSIDMGSARYGYGSETASSQYSQSGHSDQSRLSESQLSSGYRGSSDSQVSGGDYRSSDQLRSRLIGGGQSSSRIIIRPGTRVLVPVAVQSSYDQRSEADSDHRSGYSSSGNPKYYESSSSYRKEWEKHDTRPMVGPLAEPSTPTRSELYDDSQVEQISDKQYDASATDVQSSHGYSRYNTNAQTSSSQSRHQADYSSQHQGSTGFHSDVTTGSVGRSSNLIGEDTSKPKSYQSSYSYHKAWERQGDPYVIVPNTKVADDHASQRLSSGYDQSYGSQSRQSSTGYTHGCSIQCDETSHLRVSRSVDFNTADERYPSQNFEIGQEETGQQEQTGWGNVENLEQQSQSGWDQLQDFGQESQSTWVFPYGQQPETDDMTNFDQQSQAKIENLDDFGQQVQSSWDKVEASDQKNKVELTEPQKKRKEQLEDLSQHLQSATENVEKFGLQLPDKNDKTGYFIQQIGDNPEENVQLQHTQDKWHDIESSGQQIQNSWDQLGDVGQQSQQSLGKLVPDQAEQAYRHQTQEASLKPMWQQSQDGVVTVENKTTISSEGKLYHWGNVNGHNYQQSEDSSNVNHSSHSTSNGGELDTHWQEVSNSTDTQRQSNSLHDLWGMIENFEKVSSKPKDDAVIQTNVQNNDSDWRQMRVPMTDSSLSQPTNSDLSPGGQNSNSKTDLREIIPSHDSGRGDISDLDETLLSVTTAKTKPINVDLQSSDRDHRKPETTLSVLSIQDWLSQEKQHESGLHYKPIKPISNVEQHDTTLGQKPLNQGSQEKLLEQTPEEIQLTQLGFQQELKPESLEQQVQSTWGSSEVLQKPKETTWEKLEDLGQVQHSSSKSDDSVQQSQSTWEKSEDLGQQTQTAWGSSESFDQQFQSGWEKSEDLGQQTQTVWVNPDDFGQQVQTPWQPSSNFQSSETQQQTQDFGALRSDNDQGQHVYEEIPKTPIVNEDIQSHRVQDLQVPHDLATTVPTTTEVITEKPGFWRGVGNKLSNAKDAVYSWFRS